MKGRSARRISRSSSSTSTPRKSSGTWKFKGNGKSSKTGVVSNYKKRTSGHSGRPKVKVNSSERRRDGALGYKYGSGSRSGSRRRPSNRKQAIFDPSRFINTNPVETTPEKAYVPEHGFDTFGLTKELVEIIHGMKITVPTPIQDKIIPKILAGQDVIGLAETGTGKTAAFLIPLIEMTLKEKARQTLILAPTRELAIQIEVEFKRLSKNLKLYATVCVGGMNIRPQIRNLQRKNHFIIGTPGRVMDLIKRDKILPENITSVVLDEADRMLDMGFVGDMRTILKDISKERETLFFSATMSKAAEKLVNDFMREPITVSVKKKDVTNSIEQDIVRFNKDDKFKTLIELLEQDEFKRVIIFGAMKRSVEELSRKLRGREIKAQSIHGNKNHSQRQKALAMFKSGNAEVLVATDVAARGIHVDNVSHVINYDLPQSFEDYVHRIGRTGRGDKKGKALTFVLE